MFAEDSPGMRGMGRVCVGIVLFGIKEMPGLLQLGVDSVMCHQCAQGVSNMPLHCW